MGKIITIASQKGGVGKTTTSLNLGFGLSRFGQRVLIIDTDPQGGIGIASNLKARTSLGMIDIITNRHSVREVIAITNDKTMGIVGSGVVEPDDVFDFERAAHTGRLSQLIGELSVEFDYTIVDAPAGTGGIVSALLKGSDGTILVANCKNMTIKTLPQFLKLFKYVQNKFNPNLLLEGILVTMYDSSSPTEVQVLQDMRQSFPSGVFFNTLVHFREVYEKASLYAVPVSYLSEGQDAGRVYIDLAMELREREMRTMNQEGESDAPILGLFGAA